MPKKQFKLTFNKIRNKIINNAKNLKIFSKNNKKFK